MKGGSYVKKKDGSLERVEFTADQLHPDDMKAMIDEKLAGIGLMPGLGHYAKSGDKSAANAGTARTAKSAVAPAPAKKEK